MATRRVTSLPLTAQATVEGSIILAGVCSLFAGTLGAVAWVIGDNATSGFELVSIILAIAATGTGGLAAVCRNPLGVAIGGGGATLLVGDALDLVGRQLGADGGSGSLATTDDKLLVAAGVVGLVAIATGFGSLQADDERRVASRAARGGGGSAGAAVALVGFVPVFAIAVIMRADETQDALQIGALSAYVVVGVVIAVGGLRGGRPVIASVVAACVHLPIWVGLAKGQSDATIAVWIGLAALVAVAALGLTCAQASRVPTNHQDRQAVDQAELIPAWFAKPVGSVPGQWAADPFGRFESRYWNGEQWTEHVLSNGAAATDPI